MSDYDKALYDAYNAGREAFEQSTGTANSNPYAQGSALFNAWQDGFFDAVAQSVPVDDAPWD